MGISQLNIRRAGLQDATALARLLGQMEYAQDLVQLKVRLQQLLDHPQELLLVAEVEQQACAFLSMHFIPQLALAGDFARISYFCVDEALRGQQIGAQLLHYAEQQAKARGCDRMELHSATYRMGAHRFYFSQGYEESPKYLIKKL
jgi:GNAT superfamily N-acetyltransferase